MTGGSPYFNIYTLSTVLFHKYGEANGVVTNRMSQFSMFVSTKATVKLANVNMGQAQGIVIVLCSFTNYFIIYPVGQFYYCLGHTYNTISSGALKVYVGFQRVTSESLKHLNFLTLKVFLGYQLTGLKTISTIFK